MTGLILAAAAVSILLLGSRVSAKPAAAISLGTTVIPEGDDFATRVLGMPWDMTTGPYPGFRTVVRNVDRNTFTVANSMWFMDALTGGPGLFLHWPSIHDTQIVLRLGDSRPIDTDKYRLLSIRLCADSDDFMNFYWWNDRFPEPPALPNPSGISDFVATSTGCHVYAADMDNISTSQGTWSGTIKGLRVDPVTLNSNSSFQVDWVRLTTADTSNIVPINWNGATPGSSLYFYASPTACGAGGTLIGRVNGASANGTFNWGSSLVSNPNAFESWEMLPLPESFEPGDYFIYMLENDAGPPMCAGSTLEVHKAPILEFKKPSFLSGPDYATEVVGDPWGMSNAQDITNIVGFSSTYFQNGLFGGVTNTDGNNVTVQTTAPMNASKYKYVSWRFRMLGEQDIGLGWVQRFIWWNLGPGQDPVTMKAVIIFENWHTYTVDLSQALMEPGGNWSGNPTGIRFDPHELPPPIEVQLDFVLLTGDEKVPSGTPFQIIYETDPGAGETVSLFYDTDQNPANGRSPVTLLASSPPPAALGGSMVYLPLIRRGLPEINVLEGLWQIWDTSGVPAGTYYISADVNDGVMTTTWYSELPVIIE